MAFGVGLVIFSTLCFGLGDVIARRAMFHLSPAGILFITVPMTCAALGAAVLISEGPSAFSGHSLLFFGLVVLMGFLAYVSGNVAYFHGLKRAGVTLAAPILGAGPLFGVFLAVTLGGERPGVLTFVGALIIVAGVAMLVGDRQRVTE